MRVCVCAFCSILRLSVSDSMLVGRLCLTVTSKVVSNLLLYNLLTLWESGKCIILCIPLLSNN